MALSLNIPIEQDQHALLRSLIIDQLDQNSLNIPLLPVVANQVLLLSSDSNGDAAKLSTVIHQDQALAAKILHIANSPAYLPRTPIVSLQQAIAWLGLNMLANLAFSISVQKGIFAMKGYEKEIRTLWHHALATGLFAQEIARRIRRNVENAFLCGLLHEIGKPLLLHLMMTSGHFPQTPPSWALINALFEEWHIPAGIKLAEVWTLPDSVQEAIRFSSDQTFHQATSPTKGAIITCLANHLASWVLDPSSHDEDKLRSLPVVHALNFYPEDMSMLLDQGKMIQHKVEAFLV
jgi:HD-like signal output (HDOD) protein